MRARLADDLTLNATGWELRLAPGVVEVGPSEDARLEQLEGEVRWLSHQQAQLIDQVTAQTDLLARLVALLTP